MKVNISIAEVRKVCETLLKENGDVFETSRKTNVSVDDVRRIKEGRYMKSISETYFDSSKWSDNATAGVQEPEPVQLVMDDFDKTETEKKETKKKETEKSEPTVAKHTFAKITEPMVCEICNLLLAGTKHGDIANKFNISMSAVSSIRRKRTWKVVSDRFFECVSDHGSAIKNIKSGEVVINPKDRWYASTLHVETKGPVISATTDNHTRDIIDEILELAVKCISLNRTIDELPEPIKTKVLEVIKNEIGNMSISQIKEITDVR